MGEDERRTYDWIRLLIWTKDALKQQVSDRDYLSRVGVLSFSDAYAHAEAYSAMKDAEVSIDRKVQFAATEARASAKRAFAKNPGKLKEMEELIDEHE